eukprot:gene16216-22380_t
MPGLAQAYTILADAGLAPKELMEQLSKVVRIKVHSFKGSSLASIVVSLACLQYRDTLLLNELVRWMGNKFRNLSPSEACNSLYALATLRYYNKRAAVLCCQALVKRQLPEMSLSELEVTVKHWSRGSHGSSRSSIGHMGQHDPALVTLVTGVTWVFMIQHWSHGSHGSSRSSIGHMGLHDPALVTLVTGVTWVFMIQHWSHGST